MGLSKGVFKTKGVKIKKLRFLVISSFMAVLFLALGGCVVPEESEDEANVEGIDLSSLFLALSFDKPSNIKNDSHSNNRRPQLLLSYNYAGYDLVEGIEIKLYGSRDCSSNELAARKILEADIDGSETFILPTSGDKHYYYSAKILSNGNDETSGCSDSVGYILDSVAPLATEVSSPGSSDQTSYRLEGSCEVGFPVEISGAGLWAGDAWTPCNDVDENKGNNAGRHSGVYSIGLALAKSSGQNSLTLKQTDLAGNTSNPTIYTVDVQVDGTSSEIVVTSGRISRLASYALMGECEAGIAVEISGSGIDLSQGVSSLSATCNDLDNDLKNNANQRSGKFSKGLTLTAGDGSKNIIISQTDASGNSSSRSIQVLFTTAVNAPSLLFGVDGPDDQGFSNNNNPTFEVQGISLSTASGELKLYSSSACSGAEILTTRLVQADTQKIINLSTPLSSDGLKQFSTKVIDDNNSESNCSNSISYTLDRVSPVVTVNALADLSSGNRGSYSLTGNCTVGDEKVKIILKDEERNLLGPEEVTCNSTGNAWSFTFNLTSVNLENSSNPIFTASQADAAGNNHHVDATLVVPNCIGTTYTKGAGTSSSPYVICDIYQLQGVNDNLRASYILGQDIDASVTNPDVADSKGIFSQSGFTPIGGVNIGNSQYNSFIGGFDGKGKTIRGLHIISSNGRYSGFFGKVSGLVLIKNIIIAGLKVSSSLPFTGGLIGFSSESVTVSNNQVEGIISLTTSANVEGGGAYVGVLIGRSTGNQLINSNHTSGTLSISSTSEPANVWIGGFIGALDSTTFLSSKVIENKSTTTILVSRGTRSGLFSVGAFIGAAAVGVSLLDVSNNIIESDSAVDRASGSSGGLYYGGLAGMLNTNRGMVKMNDNMVVGSFTAKGGSHAHIGGLIGYLRKTLPYSSIPARNSVMMNLSVSLSTAKTFVGGLIGYEYLRHGLGGQRLAFHNYLGNSIFGSGEGYYASLIGRMFISNKTADTGYYLLQSNYSTTQIIGNSAGQFSLSIARWLANVYTAKAKVNNLRVKENYFDTTYGQIWLNGTQQSSSSDPAELKVAWGLGHVTLSCNSGFSSADFIAGISSVSGAPTCNNDSPTIFYNWHVATDIDGDSNVDQRSIRYDSNGDGNITTADRLVWDFGSGTEYPMLDSLGSSALAKNQQSTKMASALLRFKEGTTPLSGAATVANELFAYNVGSATSVTITGYGLQGTTVSYSIVDAKNSSGTALAGAAIPTVASNSIDISSLVSGDKFSLKAVFTKGTGGDAATFARNFGFRK